VLRPSGKYRPKLLVVKPRLADDAPTELKRYPINNPDFPQQTTLGQFFDEAQWKAITNRAGSSPCACPPPSKHSGWRPNAMEPALA